MTDRTHIAVLTGDLVESTALGPDKIARAFEALEDCARTQEAWHRAPLHFTRHRGDGWQVVLARPEMALRSALAFRAALRAIGKEYDSYMGIAVGDPNGDVRPNLNDETSKVFADSGRWLEWAKNKVSSGETRLGYGSGTLIATAVLADEISRNWTPAQAAAVLLALPPTEPAKTATEIADVLGKSRQAVSKSLAAAKFDPLLMALRFIEANPHA